MNSTDMNTMLMQKRHKQVRPKGWVHIMLKQWPYKDHRKQMLPAGLLCNKKPSSVACFVQIQAHLWYDGVPTAQKADVK